MTRETPPSDGSRPSPEGAPSPGVPLESTQTLLERARAGDRTAREALASRYLVALRRFAHGRIPAQARDLVDTEDLVQVAIVRTLNHIDSFVPEREGSLLAYLRRAVLNLVRDEVRRTSRRPPHDEIPETLPASALDPLEELISTDEVRRYEAALERIPAEHQEAFMLRIEMGCGFPEIAEALGCPSPNAARMMVRRSVALLVKELRNPRPR